MSAAGKAKGTRFETEVTEFLQGNGFDARRLPRMGAKDIGDVSLPLNLYNQHPDAKLVMAIIEAKNVKAMALPEWIAQSEVEADNYAAKYGNTTVPLVVHKRRGKGVAQSYLTMSLESFVEMVNLLGVR